jgi:enoyl-CoA hydratase/carnithine racemase
VTEHVIVTKAEGVLTLIMNRPDKKNALTNEMYGVLADEIIAAESDKAVRVIVVRGAGDIFTAGNDLAEFASTKPDATPGHVGRFIRAIAEMEKPLLAAVQGRAVGVGTTMLLHCDYVILAENAMLTAPFVSLGLVPEAASSVLLPLRIGHLRAFAMFALGEAVEAREALDLGLATKVVPIDQLVTAIEAAAARIARQPLGAIQATKRLMRNAKAVTAHMDIEEEEFVRRLQSPEAKEAFAAFAQRRAPEFTQFT